MTVVMVAIPAATEPMEILPPIVRFHPPKETMTNDICHLSSAIQSTFICLLLNIFKTVNAIHSKACFCLYTCLIFLFNGNTLQSQLIERRNNAREGTHLMDGQIASGWYRHPKHGLIKIFMTEKNEWVYQCFSDSGTRALSKLKTLDSWTWALCSTEADFT